MNHLEYAEDIVAGRILANENVRLQCEQVLEDHSRPPSPWVFDARQVAPMVGFIQELHHVKDEWRRRREKLKLEPWQVFWLYETFGWIHETEGTRRYTESILEVARKNAKTTLLAGMALYELIWGEAGGEIYSVATKQEQAKIVWETASQMVRLMSPKLQGNGIKERAGLLDLTTPDGNKFMPLSKESKSFDGLNPSMVIIDEAAAITDRRVIEVMLSGMVARANPMAVFITTAQYNRDTHYYNKRSLLLNRLREKQDADGLFGMVYGLEDEDDWRDESTWIKANPNLDVSVRRTAIQKQVKQATDNKAFEPEVMTKHMNRWVGAGSAWISADDWNACEVPELQKAGMCHVGIDLAETQDLTAVVCIWPRADGKYEIEHHCWLPRKAYESATDAARTAYDNGVAEGTLTVLDSRAVDYVLVREYIHAIGEEYGIEQIGCDPHNARQFVDQLEDDGHQILLVHQGIGKLSAPTKMFSDWIVDKKLMHVGDSLLRWQAGNAELYVDVNANHKVRKVNDDKSAKVDSIIAGIIAAACAQQGVEEESKFGFWTPSLVT